MDGSSNGRYSLTARRPTFSLNGAAHPRVKPRVVNGKVSSRVRKAVADAQARQAKGEAANLVTVKVGDDWDGAGHRATLNLPHEFLDQLPTTDTVIRPLPRRAQPTLTPDTQKSHAPAEWQLMTPPRIGRVTVLRRMLVWFRAILMFQLGNWYDVLRRQDSEDRRAVRLRQTFERIGGTFVKIGQQMSSRLDLLPRRYCEELASMLDRFPPFPTHEAVTIIERSTGKKLDEIFSAFDPDPIGSASIACVYQAYLRETGQKVAVKVRRPGIHELFEADFRVLDVLGVVAETLALVPPNFTLNVRTEFRNSLTTELDFRREGRLGELFRRRARKADERHFTAPYVYGEYSSEQLLVQEFFSGMWLWEVLSALDHHDEAGLARMRELNLDPKVIATNLLYAHNWSIYSHIAFHADPHPANVVVRANNELVFIDFGASGHMSPKRKRLYRRSYEMFLKEDPAMMAQNALMLIEPLPPMDVNAVYRDLEVSLTNHLINIKSKQSSWYERTSASNYIDAIRIMTKYKVGAPPDMIMFARATLLYDTLAARLNPTINFYKEYERFAKQMRKKEAKKARKAFMRGLDKGFNGSIIQTVRQVAETGNELMFRAQRLMSVPYDFAVVPYVVEKWIFIVMQAIRLVLRVLVVTALGVGVGAINELARNEPIVWEQHFNAVITSPVYATIILLLSLLSLRIMMFRLSEKTRLN